MENSEWNCVLDEKDLIEGKMKLVRVQGTPVLLIKQQGQFFAIDNRCPHLGCGLSGGSLDGFWVVCPCHDWRFDLERVCAKRDRVSSWLCISGRLSRQNLDTNRRIVCLPIKWVQLQSCRDITRKTIFT